MTMNSVKIVEEFWEKMGAELPQDGELPGRTTGS
jgi:hypothetical protein